MMEDPSSPESFAAARPSSPERLRHGRQKKEALDWGYRIQGLNRYRRYMT